METKIKPELNVFLVDDNKNDLDVASEALEKFNFVNVQNFSDSEEAHLYLKHEFPDAICDRNLIILDLNMPKKNGFELLEEIKSDPKLSCYPVLIYTSSQRKEDIKRAYALGAASYVIKSIDIDHVEQVFSDLVHYWTKISVI